jgi:hypothetical protein
MAANSTTASASGSYATGQSTGAAVAEIALSQVGQGPDKYTSWYGVSSSTEWCDIFESWCQQQNGSLAISGGKQSYTPTHATWFVTKGLWHSGSEGAIPGDVMFFATEGGSGFSAISHVGIVVANTGADKTAHTVAGNTGDGLVNTETWNGGSGVVGYGRPDYANGAGALGIPDAETTGVYGILNPITDLLNVLGGGLSLQQVLIRSGLIILGGLLILIGLFSIDRGMAEKIGIEIPFPFQKEVKSNASQLQGAQNKETNGTRIR